MILLVGQTSAKRTLPGRSDRRPLSSGLYFEIMTPHAYDRRRLKMDTHILFMFSDLPATCEHILSSTAGLQGRKRHQKAVADESFAQELCKPPLPTTLDGPARDLNINEIVYIKSWLILLML